MNAVVIYLLVYAFSNLGAFAVIIAVSRKTSSGEISSFGGLFSYAPGHGVLMTVFLASLAGIPPFGVWIAKFKPSRRCSTPATTSAYVLACIAAVNTVIVRGVLPARCCAEMWMKPVPDGDIAPIKPPQPICAALGISRHRHGRARHPPRPRRRVRRSPATSPAPSPAGLTGSSSSLVR